MLPTLSPLRAAAAYYALTLGLVVAVTLTGGGTGAAMLTPAVSALLMLLVVTRDGWSRQGWASLGAHRLGLRWWPASIGVPVAVIAAGGAVAVAAGVAEWAPSGRLEDFPAVVWPALLVANVLYASLGGSLTEEIGWRGYFVPRLTALGVVPALLLSGLLHGIWHLPVVLLTDLYHPEGDRALVVPMFLASVVAFGVLAGWLRLRTGSIWPPVLVHSANNVAVLWLGQEFDGDPVTMEYLTGESGVVSLVLYGGLAAALLVAAWRASAGRGGARVSLPEPRTEGAAVVEARS